MGSAQFAWREIRNLNLTEVPDGFPADPGICALVDLWRSKGGEGRLPARSDFSHADLFPWIGFVSLVDVEHAPRRFRWRLVGSMIAEKMGRDATGCWFDDLYEGQMLDSYVECYSRATDRRLPVYLRGDLEFVGKEFIHFNSVHLPLAEGDAPVNMLLLCLQFD
ncbi:PAS domain-containing protein [Marinibaculum pumilum]|uniref:PAS domain-containing protein n=1 Tax=Marinibaculum pumilum TaxID=1766165 RepID=A0ABV7L391_9PROT